MVEKNCLPQYVRFTDQNKTHCLPPCIDLTFLPWYKTYSRFSFWINGVSTAIFVIVGCFGNGFMLWSLRLQRNQKRLRAHLFMICFWDTLLLLCVFGFLSLPCLYQDIVKLYGKTNHLLRFLHPLGSLATTASVWHILAISAERYWAVSRPLQPLRNSKITFRGISTAIFIGAALLSSLSIFESKMVNCIHPKTKEIYPQLAINNLVSSQLYVMLCHVIPDIIFRCPVPFVVITILTVLTLIGRTREVVHISIDSGRHQVRRGHGLSTPVILSIMNMKFIVCNSLFVFFEVLKLSGWKNARLFIYMADVSNFLVSVQSATNWILFITNPRKKKKKKYSMTLSCRTASITKLFDSTELHRLKLMWTNMKKTERDKLCTKLVEILVEHNIEILEFLPQSSESETDCVTIQEENANHIKAQKTTLKSMTHQFLDDIILSMTENRLEQISERLYQLEIWCQKTNLKIINECWLFAKKVFIEALTNENLTRNSQDEAVARKFASFLIGKVKRAQSNNKLVLLNYRCSSFVDASASQSSLSLLKVSDRQVRRVSVV